jgi:hypothetical protein
VSDDKTRKPHSPLGYAKESHTACDRQYVKRPPKEAEKSWANRWQTRPDRIRSDEGRRRSITRASFRDDRSCRTHVDSREPGIGQDGPRLHHR